MLYGPFTDKLPNFNDYVDADSDDVKLDFAYPTEGHKANIINSNYTRMGLGYSTGVAGEDGHYWAQEFAG